MSNWQYTDLCKSGFDLVTKVKLGQLDHIAFVPSNFDSKSLKENMIDEIHVHISYMTKTVYCSLNPVLV